LITVICEAYKDIKKIEKRLFNDEVLERFNAEWGYIDPDVSHMQLSLNLGYRLHSDQCAAFHFEEFRRAIRVS
jgi:hypothetical protein